MTSQAAAIQTRGDDGLVQAGESKNEESVI